MEEEWDRGIFETEGLELTASAGIPRLGMPGALAGPWLPAVGLRR